jgi:antitoxin VapB
MPLYIRDDDVAELARRVQQVTNARTVTDAVRLALQHELEREQGKPSLVEIGVAFSRALRARGKPESGKPADKDFIDSLYEGDGVR